MTRIFLLLACLFGATAVGLGAFGAHILKKLLSEYHLQIFETGVRYQFYHALALIATAILSRYLSRRATRAAGWMFVAGTALFSGSLYFLAFEEVLGLGEFRSILGPMTPIGGLLFIGGWVALLVASTGYKKGHYKQHSKSEE